MEQNQLSTVIEQNVTAGLGYNRNPDMTGHELRCLDKHVRCLADEKTETRTDLQAHLGYMVLHTSTGEEAREAYHFARALEQSQSEYAGLPPQCQLNENLSNVDEVAQRHIWFEI